ncbi:hypothetical protein RP20_CCG019509 [Aedes albopictus]|nr:hypothetical protein RP20_CCG019509 [Aedes albopictus]
MPIELYHRRYSRSVETEDPESILDSYVVGVVEFRPEPSDIDVRSRTGQHLDAYADLVRSDNAKVTDIIVFPELTLNTFSDSVFVPDPSTQVVPCENSTRFVLPFLSCLAAEVRKYLVINLSEIFNCKSNSTEVTQPCAPHGFVWYNTDVVFDRNGAVIARYRKSNLLGKSGETDRTTYVPEIVTFETDFGVKFGLITRSDVLLAKPALELVKQGVNDLIMPAMWQAELPFLTSTQVYESWAFTNNVNLIVAGGNHEATGNTGTGVFNGRSGAILSYVTGEPTRRLFPVRVPKIPGLRTANHIPLESSDTETGRLHGKFLEEINIERDFLEQFTTLQINPERYHDRIGQIICNGFFCCEFSVVLTIVPDQDVTHYYRFAVFDGYRSFSKHSSETHVSTCGIIMCRNQSLSSCGLPMNENSNYLAFNEIVISGKFRANGTLAMANSLDDMLHPLSVDQYTFYSSVNYSTNQQDVQLTLVSGSVANLQTFAIYAINHENFEYFNPIEAPPEPSTVSPTIEYAVGEDDTGGSSKTTIASGALQALLLVMLLVSTVRELQ